MKKVIERNIGGCGKKLDYLTISVRVLEVLKELVQKIVISVHKISSIFDSYDLLDAFELDKKLNKISELVNKYKFENKPTKRATKLSEFMREREIEAILIDSNF